MLVSAGGSHRTEFRTGTNVASGRRLGNFHDWINEILQFVASVLGNIPTPNLRGGIAEAEYNSTVEGDLDSESEAIGRASHNSYAGSSSKGKAKDGHKKTKSQKASSKKKGKIKGSSSSSAIKPVPAPAPAPTIPITSPTLAPQSSPPEGSFDTPTVTPRDPESGFPNSVPLVTFAPFTTVAPSTVPAHVPVFTFAPFSTLAPATASSKPNSTVAPIDASSNSTTSPNVAEFPTSSPAPFSGAPASLLQSVAIPTYYIVYAASAADREPTEDEYLQMNNLTIQYFDDVFSNLYGAGQPDFGSASETMFDSVSSDIDSTQYNAGIPEPKYNIYISFTTEIKFATESSVIPTAEELFDIMVEAINPTYIVNYVWQAPETPFISTQDVLMQAVEVLGTVDATGDASTFGIGDIDDAIFQGSDEPVQVLEIVESPSDAETFGQGDIPEEDERAGGGTSGQGVAGRTSAQYDVSSFGQGSATDRDFSSASLRERFILPGSTLKDTIFREDDNGPR